MNSGDIELIGSHQKGYTCPAWADGKTQARITWEGTDGSALIGARVHPGSTWERYTRLYTGLRETLHALGSIEIYQNLRLVSASLEPRGMPLCCPACDKPMERQRLGQVSALYCRRCERIIPADEIDTARQLAEVTGRAQDALDQAVAEGKLPG